MSVTGFQYRTADGALRSGIYAFQWGASLSLPYPSVEEYRAHLRESLTAEGCTDIEFSDAWGGTDGAVAS